MNDPASEPVSKLALKSTAHVEHGSTWSWLLALLLVFTVAPWRGAWAAPPETNELTDDAVDPDAAAPDAPGPDDARQDAKIADDVVAALEASDRLSRLREELAALNAELEEGPRLNTLADAVAAFVEEAEVASTNAEHTPMDVTAIGTLLRLQKRLEDLDAEGQSLRKRLETIRGDVKSRAESLGELARTAGGATDGQMSEDLAVDGPNDVTGEDGAALSVPRAGPEGEPAVVASISTLLADTNARARRVGELDVRLGDATARISAQLDRVDGAVEDARGRIFARTHPPIWLAWSADDGAATAVHAAVDPGKMWSRKWNACVDYVTQAPELMALHVVAWLALGALLTALRRQVRYEAHTATARPWLAATFLALVAHILVHPEAPTEFWELLDVASTLPLVVLIVLVIERRFWPPLLGLVGLIILDFLRLWTWNADLGSRVALCLLCAVGVGFALSYVRASRRRIDDRRETERLTVWHRVAYRGGQLTVLLMGVSAVASLLGWLNLANLLCSATLHAGYAALSVLFCYQLLHSAAVALSRSEWAEGSRALTEHRDRVVARVDRALRRLGVIGWLLAAASAFSLLRPAYDRAVELLESEIDVGLVEVSPGAVVAVLVGAWLAIVITRVISFILAEEALPRMRLERGVPQAVLTVSRIVMYAVAAFVVLAVAGISASELAIMFGALGVGIGLGLQDIVNNFVSGLVLLFERPISTGDAVELEDGTYGRVTQVGMRASRIRTWQGAEVVVPNSMLTDNNVTNWTLSDDRFRVEVDVGVAYGNDAEHVRTVLTEVLDKHDQVLDHPRPVVHFKGFGDSALQFQLRAWTERERMGDWEVTRTELNIAIQKALADAGITVPFPQRDLHIRSVAPSLGLGAQPDDTGAAGRDSAQTDAPSAARDDGERRRDDDAA